VTNRLGKGFDILVPVGLNVSDVAASSHEKVHKLAIDIVVPKKDQPRRSFDQKALDELAQSIKQHGIIQPIIVTQIEQNMYSIIAGERRWRAAKIIGLTEVPAIVRSATEHQQLEISLLENIQREDLNAIEKAITIQRLHDQFGQNMEEIAKRLGKAHTTVINITRLLGLPDDMQKALVDSVLTEGHARALLALQKQPDLQLKLFKNIVDKKWNVRQAEQFVVAVKRGNETPKASAKQPASKNIEQLTSKLKKHLNAKRVIVQHSVKGSGKIIINYSSEDELNKLTDKILKTN
jgi:ParB family transcriptional regulator, chromosome partitioning protein